MKDTIRTDIKKRICFEDNHLLIFNKRPGEIVQADKTGDPSLLDLLKDYIKSRDAKPGNVFLGCVHRLDRPTSGLVIFAKTSKALSRMNALLQAKKVEKKYLVLLDAIPQKYEAKLVHYLIKNQKQNKSYVSSEDNPGAKEAILKYKVLWTGDKYALAEVHLETGRHHQIRVQFASLGIHIRGDVKYGAKRAIIGASIGLHSYQLSFIHPIKREPINVFANPLDSQSDSLWEKVALQFPLGSDRL